MHNTTVMLSLATSVKNVQNDTVCTLLNNGYIRLYNGRQPSTDEPAPPGAQVMVECHFGSPAFAPSVGGKPSKLVAA